MTTNTSKATAKDTQHKADANTPTCNAACDCTACTCNCQPGACSCQETACARGCL